MISIRCEKLQLLLARLKHAVDQQAQAATLEPVRSDLADRVMKLHDVSRRSSVLREAKVLAKLATLPPAKMTTLRTAVETVRTNLAANPFSVTKGKDFNTVKSRLDELHEKMRGQLVQSWGAWVDGATARIDDAELGRYEKMPGLAASVNEIRKLRGLVDELPAELPATKDDFATAESRLDRLRSLIAGLPRTDDPEVRRFLDAANSPKGAGLDLITDAVIAYLKKNGMYGKYRVLNR